MAALLRNADGSDARRWRWLWWHCQEHGWQQRLVVAMAVLHRNTDGSLARQWSWQCCAGADGFCSGMLMIRQGTDAPLHFSTLRLIEGLLPCSVAISQTHRLVSQERLFQSRHLVSGGSNFYSWCVTPQMGDRSCTCCPFECGFCDLHFWGG